MLERSYIVLKPANAATSRHEAALLYILGGKVKNIIIIKMLVISILSCQWEKKGIDRLVLLGKVLILKACE